MTIVYSITGVLLLILCAPYMNSVRVGPTVFDRVLALNVLGSKFSLLLLIVVLIYERMYLFVDIALAILLLNIFTTLLLARNIRFKRVGEPKQ